MMIFFIFFWVGLRSQQHNVHRLTDVVIRIKDNFLPSAVPKKHVGELQACVCSVIQWSGDTGGEPGAISPVHQVPEMTVNCEKQIDSGMSC